MFFEPDEFDKELIENLKSDLDKDNVFVSEDLIQRTLAAVKETSEVGKNKTITSKKLNMKVWIRSFACVAACIIFIVLIKNETKSFQFYSIKSTKDTAESSGIKDSKNASDSKSDGNMLGQSDMEFTNEASTEAASGNESSIKDVTGGEASADAGSTSDSSQNDTVTYGAVSDETLNRDKSGDVSDRIVGTVGNDGEASPSEADKLDTENGEESSILAKGNSKSSVMYLDELVLMEKEKDLGKTNITYITLSDHIKEEKVKILDLEECIKDLSLSTVKNNSNDEWNYKVFTLRSEDDMIYSYFISNAGELKICKYDNNSLVSESNYKLESVDSIINIVVK